MRNILFYIDIDDIKINPINPINPVNPINPIKTVRVIIPLFCVPFLSTKRLKNNVYHLRA